MEQQTNKLQQAKDILRTRGLTQQDFKSMTYKQILALAGVQENERR